MSNQELYSMIRKPDGFCPPHINPEIEVVYVKKGVFKATYDSSEIELRPGEMTLILPYHLHSFDPAENVDAAVYMFPQSVYGDFPEHIDSSLTPNCHVCSVSADAAAYLNYLLQRPQDKRDLLFFRSLFYVFAEAYLACSQRQQTSGSPIEAIPQVVEYIFAHLAEDLTVGDIAKFIGWDARRLSTEFRKRYGMKITDLIGNIRIERATVWLETSDYTVSEIASDCGFGSLRNFNRLFKIRTGCTPSVYRQEHRERNLHVRLPMPVRK